MDLPPSGSHHRRRSSVLISSGGASQPRPATAENQEENSRSGPVDRDGPRGEEQKPLNAKDRDSSDLSSVAESEELEMDYIPSDDDLNDDEETGLTARQRSERRRRRRRQRRQLDARIAGVKASRKDGRKLADKNVIKKLLINALLIGLWYFFSLSISIVSLHVFLYFCRPGLTTLRATVQQMDVLQRRRRIPVSPVYNQSAHGCTVHSLIHNPVFCPLPSSSTPVDSPLCSFALWNRYPGRKTSHDQIFLSDAPSALRHCYLPRCRPWEHVLEIHFAHLPDYVQIIRPRLRASVCLCLWPRSPLHKADFDHCYHDYRCGYDGCG